MDFDPSTDYPLGARRPELVRTPGGRALADVTLDAVRAGELDASELRATSGTLRLQAEVARAGGRTQLAEGLERAAELAGLDDDELLAVYTALRPGRSTAQELERIAERLDGQDAPRNAAFVREALAAYRERSLLADG